MNNKCITRAFALSALFAAMLPVMQANAAAFQVVEHSAAGLGRAFAGEAAIAEDASVIARNVAGMSFLDGPMFTGAISYVMPDVDVKNSDTGYTDKGIANDAAVPVFYYVAPIDDKWSYGVGGFTNYGFTTDYSAESGITAAADLSEVMTYNLNASLSYKIQDNLSIGFGANAVYIEANLTSGLGSPNPGLAPLGITGTTLMDVSGEKWGYGWNAGVLWEPVDGTRVGLSYRSAVEATLDGKGKSDIFVGIAIPGVNPAGLNWNSKGSVDIELPSIAELSIYQQVNEQLAVHASYVKIGWSSFDEIAIKLDNNNPVPVDHQNYEDSSRWSVGATYNYGQAWMLRAGYAYDNSPVGNTDRSFRIPDSDRQWFTVGANYKIDDNQNVDMGYAYLSGKKQEIHYSENGTTINGEIESGNAHIVSLQYNYKF